MSTEPQNLVHRLLERMRAEHAASRDAMMTELAATRRVFGSMEQIHNKIDRLQADMVGLRGEIGAFRAETGKALRQVQNDIVALDNQNIARHGEILNVLRRPDDLKMSVGDEDATRFSSPAGPADPCRAILRGDEASGRG